MQSYKGIFTKTPQHVPTDLVVDGPILGNGDTGIVLGNFPDSLRFWISKNDFWRPLEGQGTMSRDRIFGSPCPIGTIDITFESMSTEAFQVEQLLQTADIEGQFYTHTQGRIDLRTWVNATENLLIIELMSSEETTMQLNLTPHTGWMSTSESGYVGDELLWIKRRFTDEAFAWNSESAVYLKHIHGGKTLGTLSYLKMKPGEKVVFAASIHTNQEDSDFAERAKSRVSSLTLSDIKKI